VAVLVVFSAIPLFSSTAIAQTADDKYYFETRHWVQGAFWNYIRETPHAAYMLGYPLTEQFYDELTQRLVQYFQHGRLEYFPGNPPDQRVVRTPLGEYMLNAADTLEPLPQQGLCEQQDHWAHPVCGEFLSFYQTFGGERSFGIPLTELVKERGRSVQYFTYARIEWQPDAYKQAPITLGHLGYVYFHDIKHEDPLLLMPIPPDNVGGNTVIQITALQVSAFSGEPVSQPDDLQSLNILVHDQSGLPVDDAGVQITVTFPDGEALTFNTLTGKRGVAKVQFKVTSSQAGVAQVRVDVDYQGGIATGVARTFFRIWDSH
jgi:hypothetical protein